MTYQEQILQELKNLVDLEDFHTRNLTAHRVKRLKALLAQAGIIPASEHPDYPFK